MLFAYLDEFGHVGPFVSRTAKKFNESPVFGLAGIILPEKAVRPFATSFLQLKEHLLAADIEKSRKMAAKWEKKGVQIFRPSAMDKFPSLRNGGFRLLNQLNRCGGKVFYYGREKRRGEEGGNSNGLYTTVMSKTIRRIDQYASSIDSNFAIVMDQHSARKDLLECAAKTMFGKEPARRLVSPPFEVESYLNQNIQAADWVASIVGRLWSYRLENAQYADHAAMESYFGERIGRLITHSSVERRPATDSKAMRTIRYSVMDAPRAAQRK